MLKRNRLVIMLLLAAIGGVFILIGIGKTFRGAGGGAIPPDQIDGVILSMDRKNLLMEIKVVHVAKGELAKDEVIFISYLNITHSHSKEESPTMAERKQEFEKHKVGEKVCFQYTEKMPQEGNVFYPRYAPAL